MIIRSFDTTRRVWLAAASLAVAVTAATPALASQAVSHAPLLQRAALDNAGGRQLIYVANALSNSIAIYPDSVKNPAPIGFITSGISDPQGLTVDFASNLFVANAGSSTVSVYRPGQAVPFLTYSAGIGEPSDVAVDRNGTLYVANQKPASIVEFARGSMKPTGLINDVTGPTALALDRSGNLFVTDVNPLTGQSRVLEYANGSTKGADLGIKLKYASGIAFDPKSGALYVADRDGNAVYGYRQPNGLRQRGPALGVWFVYIAANGPLHIVWILTTPSLLVAEAENNEVAAFAFGEAKLTGMISQKVAGPVAASLNVRLF